MHVSEFLKTEEQAALGISPRAAETDENGVLEGHKKPKRHPHHDDTHTRFRGISENK
jgi:hypothetical protein